MSGLVQFSKYINAPIAAKYGVSGPKYFSPSSHGLNSSFFGSNDHTTIGELSGWAASIEKRLSSFRVYKLWCRKILQARCSICMPRQKVVSPRFFISNPPLSCETISKMTLVVSMMLRSSTYKATITNSMWVRLMKIHGQTSSFLKPRSIKKSLRRFYHILPACLRPYSALSSLRHCGCLLRPPWNTLWQKYSLLVIEPILKWSPKTWVDVTVRYCNYNIGSKWYRMKTSAWASKGVVGISRDGSSIFFVRLRAWRCSLTSRAQIK